MFDEVLKKKREGVLRERIKENHAKANNPGRIRANNIEKKEKQECEKYHRISPRIRRGKMTKVGIFDISI